MWVSIYCTSPTIGVNFEVRLKMEDRQWTAIIVPSNGGETRVISGDDITPALNYFAGVFHAVKRPDVLALPAGD
jgi:hypothetical protein